LKYCCSRGALFASVIGIINNIKKQQTMATKASTTKQSESKASATKAQSANTKMSSRSKHDEGALMDLFVDSLKDINWAEKNLISALKKMAKAATSEKLKTAFQEHMTQTEAQLERLGSVFQSIDKKQTSKKCAAMQGLIEEAQELIEETEDGSEVRDVALIAAAQKVEHYEIATYGTLRTLAATLGLKEAQQLLEQTLEEEKQTDMLLTEIAENSINKDALQDA